MTGDRLGKWVIFQELGRGGMGRVYLAQEEMTGRQAAIKILAAELAQEVGFLQRFQREIDALRKLTHPNIVRFYEAGFENDRYYYAMEYIEGLNLDQILHEQNRMLWKDVLNIAVQVTAALKHVHDHGIIHRDIKPSNLILDAEGKIKLTDFGIAKVFASTHLTATGGIVGTAEYLSPEQAAGKVVGKRSDLYCLGCVLYRLVTGRTPFAGNSYVELLHKHRYAQFDRPRKFIPELPIEIDEVICQLLEKDPDKRQRDAVVLLKQLEGVQRKLENQLSLTSADNREAPTKVENRTGTPIRGLPLSNPPTEPPAKSSGGFFNHPIVLVAILLFCVGFLVWKLWPPSQEELFRNGAELMQSGRLADMDRAWSEYLGPLESRFPDHPYRAQLAEFRGKWEDAKSPHSSEAKRFYQQGELLQKQGNPAAAQKIWTSLIDAFGEVDAEKQWVAKARTALAELDRAGDRKDRWLSVREAIERSRELRAKGRADEAERILVAIEELYRNDPSAREILDEVKKARAK
jgi:serine/threonine-protein kinase